MTRTITEFNIYKIKQELLNKFRTNFNFNDPLSRVTETTTTFDGDGSETKFILSATKLSYVKSVTVDGSPLDFGTDWDIHWRGDDIGKVETTVAPSDDTDNVVIVWGKVKETNANFVWSDWPKSNLGIHSYPRIGFKTTVRRKAGGLGGDQAVFTNDILIQIKVVDVSSFEIDYLVSQMDAWITANSKTFYYFNWMEPQSIAEYDNYDDNTAITSYKIIEYIIPRKIQVVSYA